MDMISSLHHFDRLPLPGQANTEMEQSEQLQPGQFQAVHFFLAAQQLAWFISRIETWFEDRDEVILVGSGISAQEQGFIILEWEETTIDPLFLKILEYEESVLDICVYTRTEEVH